MGVGGDQLLPDLRARVPGKVAAEVKVERPQVAGQADGARAGVENCVLIDRDVAPGRHSLVGRGEHQLPCAVQARQPVWHRRSTELQC